MSLLINIEVINPFWALEKLYVDTILQFEKESESEKNRENNENGDVCH